MNQILGIAGYIAIKDIKVGDEVVAFDLVTGETIINVVEEIHLWDKDYDAETHGDFDFYLVNNTWKLYKNQTVWVNGGGKHAFQLEVGDVCYNDNNEDFSITSITKTTDTEWYRFSISGDHSYIADGIQLHNASRYWVGGGSTVNWTATANTNWASGTGLANNQSVPTTADEVFFDSGSAASTISAIITVINFTRTTGYTGTITRSAVLTLTGNFTDAVPASGGWAGASSMTISGVGTNIITFGGTTWGNAMLFSGTSTTKSISGPLIITGLLTITPVTAMTINWAGADTSTLTLNGGLTQNTVGITGTAKIILGGGTWSTSSSAVGMTNNLDFAGTILLGTNTRYATGTMTLVSGTVNPQTGTLTIAGSATLNTSGITFNNVTINTAGTLTLNSALSVGLTLSLAAATIFAGSFGWTAHTFTSTVAGNTHTLRSGVTYAITNAFNITAATLASRVSFVVSTPGVVAVLNLNAGATQNIVFTNATDINSAGGIAINTFQGTVSNSSNWTTFSTLYFVGNTSAIWGTNTNWSLTSGGATLSVVPNSTTDVILNASSASAVTINASSNCRTLTASLYTGLFTLSASLICAGNITLGSGMTTAGTSTLTLSTTGTILTSSGVTWVPSITLSGASIFTLADNWTVTGLLSLASTPTFNGNIFHLYGGITVSGVTAGTTTITLYNGTWSGASSLRNQLTLDNTLAGAIIVSGSVAFGTSSLTYIAGAGTISTTSSTLTLITCTISTVGMSWNNITIAVTSTITNNTLLTAGGILLLSGTGAIVFTGAGGFLTSILTITTTGTLIHTLAQANTYTVSSAFNNTGSTNALRTTLASSSGSLPVVFTLNQGATVNLGYLNATWINSSLGRTIRTFSGTLAANTTTNWLSFTDVPTTGASS